jgi:hypothetical protein
MPNPHPTAPSIQCRDQGPFDLVKISDHCRDAWGVEPVVDNHVVSDGGLDYRCASNPNQWYCNWI